jgi:excisionase family DNA binding protein
MKEKNEESAAKLAPTAESYLTVQEAAALLRCSAQSVARLVQTGRLPGIDVGTGKHHSYRIKASEIDTLPSSPFPQIGLARWIGQWNTWAARRSSTPAWRSATTHALRFKFSAGA